MECESYKLASNNYSSEFLIKLKQLKDSGSLTDVVLCVDHEEIPCHKLVLAVSSSYFSTMFSTDLRENRESRVTLNQVSPWVMKRLIDYAYTGYIEITTQNVQDVLAASCLFQYPAVVDACCQFLKQKLDSTNCLGIEQFAHMHLCSQLGKDAHKFALENFSVVVEHNEFVQLSFEDLLRFVADDDIDVVNESVVFEACLKWIYYDFDKRKTHFCTLMKHIRFVALDLNFINTVVKKEEHIIHCNDCINLVDCTFKLLTVDESGCCKRDKICQRRPSTVAKEMIFIIGGVDEERSILHSMYGFNCQKRSYFALPDLPETISFFSFTTLNNVIYITGGISNGHIVANSWRFIVENKQWSVTCPMQIARARHASSTWNNKIYVVGGIMMTENDQHEICLVKQIECYDPTVEQWTVVGYASSPRKHSCLIVVNNAMLEIGGIQGSVPVDRTDCYICQENLVICSGEQFLLPESIQHCQAIVVEGLLYIIWMDKRKMVSLDPVRRVYRELASPHYEHLQGSATAINGQIWLLGGGQRPSTAVESYDPQNDLWTICTPLPEPRACHGCVTVVMT